MFTTPQGRYSFKVTTPPVVEPLSLQEAKAALNIDASDNSQDERLARLIRSARELAEAFTGRAFIAQGLTLQLDGWPLDASSMPWWGGERLGSRKQWPSSYAPLSLPRPPAISVQSVTYAVDGTTHTLDPDLYALDDVSEPGRLILDAAAPQVTGRASFTVRYTAGYGASPADVPAVVSEAILAHLIDAVQRPNAGVSSERVDNASVVYGGATLTSAATAASGLRGGAADLLKPLRLRRLGG